MAVYRLTPAKHPEERWPIAVDFSQRLDIAGGEKLQSVDIEAYQIHDYDLTLDEYDLDGIDRIQVILEQLGGETQIYNYPVNDKPDMAIKLPSSWDPTEVTLDIVDLNTVEVGPSHDPPEAPTAELIATDTGNVDDGEHRYLITFAGPDGETRAGNPSNVVTVDSSHKQVRLQDIPVGTEGIVTQRKIYRTKAGGTTYYYLDTIDNNVETEYTDNTADGDLGADTAPTQNTLNKKTRVAFEVYGGQSGRRYVIVLSALTNKGRLHKASILMEVDSSVIWP